MSRQVRTTSKSPRHLSMAPPTSGPMQPHIPAAFLIKGPRHLTPSHHLSCTPWSTCLSSPGVERACHLEPSFAARCFRSPSPPLPAHSDKKPTDSPSLPLSSLTPGS